MHELWRRVFLQRPAAMSALQDAQAGTTSESRRADFWRVIPSRLCAVKVVNLVNFVNIFLMAVRW